MTILRSPRVTLAVHTPGYTPADQLAAFTVGREHELAVLRDALHAAATGDNRSHVLITGPRGSGKTHLLTLAADLARRDPELASHLLVAQPPEDLYRVTDYTDLLVAVMEAIGAPVPGRDPRTLERELLHSAGERVLVLVVENLHRLFALLGEPGQRELRSFVQTHGKVLLLASTPNLVEDLGDHGMPFYGFFRTLPLGELDPEHGRELLLRLAKLEGNDELGVFLASDTGLQRLRAIASLAGGSPRLWLLLAGCLTIELLDEVVPLFVEVLDQLTPYYMARLSELSPERAKLVSHLCHVRLPDGSTGQAGGRTVRELAAATGMSPQAAAKQLHELQRLRYVVARKVPGTDQRETFYEVREPMLAHCLTIKEHRDQPLEVVVRMLRTWYATADLRAALGRAPAGSPSEAHLGAALAFDPGTDRPRHGVELVDVTTARDLLVEARRILAAPVPGDGLITSRVAAAVAEAVALAVLGDTRQAEQAYQARTRQFDAATQSTVSRMVTAAVRAAAEGTAGDLAPPDAAPFEVGVIAGVLEIAADQAAGLPPDDLASVAILAAGWALKAGRPGSAVERLQRLTGEPPAGCSDRMRLALDGELAFMLAAAGDLRAALRLGKQCLRDRTARLGRDHPDTLTSRGNVAHWTGEAGDAAAARDLYADVVADRVRVLGADHPDTLVSRGNHAWWVGAAGAAAAARDLYADVVADCVRVLGADHRGTLTIRHNHAYWVGRAGAAAAARDLYADVVADCVRVLGADHPDTLVSRGNHAWWVGAAGAAAAARDLYAEVVEDHVRTLGPHHPNTFASRRVHAYWVAQVGDVEACVATLRGLLDDQPSWPEADRTHLSLSVAGLVARVGEAALRAHRQGHTDGLQRFLQGESEPFVLSVLLLLFLLVRSPDHRWILEESTEAGHAKALASAVLLNIRRPTALQRPSDVLAFVQDWEELARERDESAYGVLARQLAAVRAAVFEGNEEPLVRLSSAERIMARETIADLASSERYPS